jgi:hypothetical protein
LIACNQISDFGRALQPATPTLPVTSTALPTQALPTPSVPVTATTMPTVAPSPTSTRVVTPAESFQIPVMPEAQTDGPFSKILGKRGVSNTVLADLEAVQNFYQETLTSQGWEWIFTDVGQAIVFDGVSPILAQEFKQGDHRLAIVAIEERASDKTTATSLVMSAQDISSGELFFSFNTLMSTLYSVSGMSGDASEEDIKPATLQFNSEIIRFKHPSNWFPTRVQMITFPTDIGANNINILRKRCANNHQTCFVNFLFLTGAIYPIPVSIRTHSVESETTLEYFDTQRWAELINTPENQLSNPDNIEWPEDLTEAGSLETIEINSVVLQDGTPALQRIYHWRQTGLSTPLIGSYTLFKRNDSIIEFHTDFTEEEWAANGPHVQETILSIELTQ